MSSDHRRLALVFALTLIFLAFSAIAFGDGLSSRPANYTPVDYLTTSCSGPGSDTTVFRFGLDGDVRWAEIFVMDTPGHELRIAVAAFAPGSDGELLFAEVLLPSGQIIRFDSVTALRNSPYAEVCQVANTWLQRL